MCFKLIIGNVYKLTKKEGNRFHNKHIYQNYLVCRYIPKQNSDSQIKPTGSINFILIIDAPTSSHRNESSDADVLIKQQKSVSCSGLESTTKGE